jgi:putative flavoprotein involved in K+ transport
VTLAVGEHIRLPRTYRGRDIQHWMDAIGVLDERFDEVDDIVRARRVPSPQLVGTPARESLDLNTLQARGVSCVGRLVGITNGKAQFSGSLRNHCAMADLKMRRLLDRIDEWATCHAVDAIDATPDRPAPTGIAGAPRLFLDLTGGEIRTIVWATGYRPDYRWLEVPVLDGKGRIRHTGGVVDAPGLYVMGLSFMRRRRSSFIHGAEADARDLSAHLAERLDQLSAGLHQSHHRAWKLMGLTHA